MLSIFILLLIVMIFLLSSVTLIGRLISLEIFSFFVIFSGVVYGVFILIGSYYILIYFVVFVLEGVIGILSLISLVSYVGSDYVMLGSVSLW